MKSTLFTKPLQSILAQYPVQSCYLFGSQAEGNATSESDYDIAVFVPDARAFDHTSLIKQVSAAFIAPEKLQLSIVDLTNTSPLFLMQIIKGTLLFEHKKQFHIALESLIMRMYFDDQYRNDVYYQALKQKYDTR